MRPVVLNERGERARGFREVVEGECREGRGGRELELTASLRPLHRFRSWTARICIHEEIEKGIEGFGSDDEETR